MEIQKIRNITRIKVYKQILEEVRLHKRRALISEGLGDAAADDSFLSGEEYELKPLEEVEKEAQQKMEQNIEAFAGQALGQFVSAANEPERLGRLVDRLVALSTVPVTDDELIEMYGIICRLVEQDRDDLLYTKTVAALYANQNESFFEFLVNTFNPLDPINLLGYLLIPFTGPGGFALLQGARAGGKVAAKQSVKAAARKSMKRAATPDRAASRELSQQTLSTAFTRGRKEMVFDVENARGARKFVQAVTERHEVQGKVFEALEKGFERQLASSAAGGAQRTAHDVLEDLILKGLDETIDGRRIKRVKPENFDDFMKFTFEDPAFVKSVFSVDGKTASAIVESLSQNKVFRKNLSKYYDEIGENFNRYDGTWKKLSAALEARGEGGKIAGEILRDAARLSNFIAPMGAVARLSRVIRDALDAGARKLGRQAGEIGARSPIGAVGEVYGLSRSAAKKIADDMFVTEDLIEEATQSILTRFSQKVSKFAGKQNLKPGDAFTKVPKLQLFSDSTGLIDADNIGKQFRKILLETGGEFDVDKAIKIVRDPAGDVLSIEVDADLLRKLNPELSEAALGSGTRGRGPLTIGMDDIKSLQPTGMTDREAKRMLGELAGDMDSVKRYMNANKAYYKQYAAHSADLVRGIKDEGARAFTRDIMKRYAMLGVVKLGAGTAFVDEGFNDAETYELARAADAAGAAAVDRAAAAEAALDLYLAAGIKALDEEQIALLSGAGSQEEADAMYDSMQDAAGEESRRAIEKVSNTNSAGEILRQEEKLANKEYYDGLIGWLNHYDDWLNYWNSGGQRRVERLGSLLRSQDDEMADDIDRINFLDAGFIEDAGVAAIDLAKGAWSGIKGVFGGEETPEHVRKARVARAGGRQAEFTGDGLDWLTNNLAGTLRDITKGRLGRDSALTKLGVGGWLDSPSGDENGPDKHGIVAQQKSVIKGAINQYKGIVDRVQVGELEELWALYEQIEAAKPQQSGIKALLERESKETSSDGVQLTEAKLRALIRRSLQVENKQLKKKRLLSEDASGNSNQRFLTIQSQLAQLYNEKLTSLTGNGLDDIYNDCAMPVEADKRLGSSRSVSGTDSTALERIAAQQSEVWHDWMMAHHYGSQFSMVTNSYHSFHGILLYKWDNDTEALTYKTGVAEDARNYWTWIDGDKTGSGVTPINSYARDSVTSGGNPTWKAHAEKMWTTGGQSVNSSGPARDNAWAKMISALSDKIDSLDVEAGEILLPIMFRAMGPRGDISSPENVMKYQRKTAQEFWDAIRAYGPAMETKRTPGQGGTFELGPYVMAGFAFTDNEGRTDEGLLGPLGKGLGKKLKLKISPDGAPMPKPVGDTVPESIESEESLLDRVRDTVSVGMTPEKAREEFVSTIESRGPGGDGTFGLVVLSEPKRGARLINNFIADIALAGLFIKLNETDWLREEQPTVWDGFYSANERRKGAKINQTIGDWPGLQDAYIHILEKAVEAKRGIFRDPDAVAAFQDYSSDPGLKGWIHLRPRLAALGYSDYEKTSNVPNNQGDIYDFAKFLRDLANDFSPARDGKQVQRDEEGARELAQNIWDNNYKNTTHEKMNDPGASMSELVSMILAKPYMTDREIRKMVSDAWGTAPEDLSSVQESINRSGGKKSKNIRVSRAFRGKK